MKARIVKAGIGLYKVQYKKYFFSKWKYYMSFSGSMWIGSKVQAEVIKMKILLKWI